MESTPPRDNRDIIIDATLFSDNLAEVRNRNAKVFGFVSFISVSAVGLKTTFSKMKYKELHHKYNLVNTDIITWIGIYKHACTNVW